MCVLFLEVSPAGPNRAMTPCMFTEGARLGVRGGLGGARRRADDAFGARSRTRSDGSCRDDERAGRATAWSERANIRGRRGGCARAVSRDGSASRAQRSVVASVARRTRGATVANRLVEGAGRHVAAPRRPASRHAASSRALSAARRRLCRRDVGTVRRAAPTTLHNRRLRTRFPAAQRRARRHRAGRSRAFRRGAPARALAPAAHRGGEGEPSRVDEHAGGFFLLLPFSYLAATYAAFVVKERAGRATLQQRAPAGAHETMYWPAPPSPSSPITPSCASRRGFFFRV